MMKASGLLVAYVGESAIAVKIASVRQILGYQKSFKVPKSPALLSGIMHAKGGVVPIINIADALGMRAFDPHPFRVAVVVESEGTRFSFICDQVKEIVEVNDVELSSASYTGENMFIEKTLECKGVTTQLVNIPALLTLVHGNSSLDDEKERA